ncbi:MAG: SPASM domain-containing protein [Crocinitomicaceae bacterium]|nr:SPASM domain-containing protein [Crocinitomicaceae bacterium]
MFRFIGILTNFKFLLKEQFEILSFLNERKLKNILKLRLSYFKSKISKKVQHSGRPFSISIEPTTACNLGCPECPSGLKKFTRPTGKLQLEMNRKIIDELKDDLLYITYYFQGEPFINRNFLDMVRYANENKIYTATSTNAHFLSPEACEEIIDSGLNKLIISLDGLDQKTYETYRIGGELNKVIEGMQNLFHSIQKRGKGPHVIVQFLVFKSNEHQIPELKKWMKQFPGFELKLKSAQFYEFEDGNVLMPENEKYSRYKKIGEKFKIDNTLENSCWRLWSSCVFTWDGKLVPCCFDKDAEHIAGDLSIENFDQIWQGSTLNEFRKTVFTDRSEIEICKNCSEGSKVWM